VGENLPNGTLRQARSSYRAVALVPAAGRGLRVGGPVPKQFLALGGEPILVHALWALEAADSISSIIIAVPEADREYCHKEIVTRHGFKKVTNIVAGGERRQDSVRYALFAAKTSEDLVLVHDAVRPFLTQELIRLVIEEAAEHGEALIAVPMRDTVKQIGRDGVVVRTVDRHDLWLAQTPQAFKLSLLKEAHQKAEDDGFYATDDAQLVERLKGRITIIEGSAENIKITRPEDLIIGEAILAARRER
jgi:2-C-methyl-D-erythritol 4-phosphate cytidylyltransferase